MSPDRASPATTAHWTLRRFWIFWLALLLGTVALLALGGRPDPVGSARPLDGPWLFHAGDDPAWASPDLDDRSWDRITLVSNPKSRDGDVGIPGYLDGWRARGHPGLDGYGWYRRQVTLPPRGDLALIGPPAADDGYELFWNGRRVGGMGRLNGAPRIGATRPLRIDLPPANGAHSATLAIRAFMDPNVDHDAQSGGLRTVPTLASRADGAALYRAQWARTIAGYVVDAVEPVALLVLAVLAAVAARALARPAFARWVAVALTASACSRLGNAIIAWTDILSLPGLIRQNDLIVTPLVKLAWTIAWNQWTDGRRRQYVSAAAIAGWAALVAAALTHIQPLAGVGRAVFALSLLAIAIRIARQGEQRLLALTAMAVTSIGLFAADLSTLGVPGIWFPFGIGVSRSQYAYALALPLLAYALAAGRRSKTAPSR